MEPELSHKNFPQCENFRHQATGRHATIQLGQTGKRHVFSSTLHFHCGSDKGQWKETKKKENYNNYTFSSTYNSDIIEYSKRKRVSAGYHVAPYLPEY